MKDTDVPVGEETRKFAVHRTEKKPNTPIPLPTKIIGWLLLAPVLVVAGIAVWAVCWKAGRFLVEWALG